VKKRYKKKEDVFYLEKIKEVQLERPSYGYKRITAMINKNPLNTSRINRKRIYRIMDMNDLLIKKTKITREHEPTRKIVTLHSNTRWCSDAFEIKCYNDEKVYVMFSLDTCDRECIEFVARKRPLQKKDVQELMISSVNKRFACDEAPNLIQWLSDRGSIYRAHETQRTARSLNLKSCFTAAYSPQSNGMAESFVKTIKRDYVYVNDCETADQTIAQLGNWIKDYNENAPHSGLGMKSPVEFKKTNPGV